MYINRAGMRKTQKHYSTTEQWWPPTQCTCIPSVLYCGSITKWTRDASALRWRPPLLRSRVMILNFSLSCLVSVTFYRSIPSLKWARYKSALHMLRTVKTGVTAGFSSVYITRLNCIYMLCAKRGSRQSVDRPYDRPYIAMLGIRI